MHILSFVSNERASFSLTVQAYMLVNISYSSYFARKLAQIGYTIHVNHNGAQICFESVVYIPVWHISHSLWFLFVYTKKRLDV